MRFYFITLFPESISSYFETSMMRKATESDIAMFEFVDLRRFGIGPRHQVDDTPFGGGDGMVLKPEPIFSAVESIIDGDRDQFEVMLPTPRGENFNQDTANSLSKTGKDKIFICGRYEGYDERITELVDHQICLGPYVLTGGELPSAVIADSIVRLIPGVLGGEESATKESFTGDLAQIEHPQYTRPASFRDMKVPDVLLSGHHGEVEKWRKEQSR